MYPSFTFGLLFYCFAVMTVTGEDLADGNCDKDGLVSNKVIKLLFFVTSPLGWALLTEKQ